MGQGFLQVCRARRSTRYRSRSATARSSLLVSTAYPVSRAAWCLPGAQAHYQHQPVPPKAPIVVPQPTGLAGPSVGNAAILAAAQSFMFQGAAAAAAAAAGSGSGDAAAGASGAGAAGGGAGPSGAEQAQEPPSWTLTVSCGLHAWACVVPVCYVRIYV